jgi:carbamoylphosphate synthase small subunit
MNAKLYIYGALALLLLIGLICVGCKMTPQKAAYTVLDSTELTADQAMQLWGSYVAEYHPPASQEQTVKDVYEKYQVAELAAIDAAALVNALTASGASPADVSAAQAKQAAAAGIQAQALGDLVNVLKQIGVKL